MIGLIFGETDFPKQILKKIKGKIKYLIIDLTKNKNFKKDINSVSVSLGQFGKIIKILKENKCKKVLFAGKVKKPSFSKIRLDLKGVYYMPRIIKSAKLSDAAILKEIITISIDTPVGVLHYEWEGQDVYKIYIKYTSNLRYMWPYSEKITSSISYKWAPEMNAAIISGQSNILSSIMGFSSKPEMFRLGQYDGFRFENMVPISNKTDLNQVSGLFCFDAKDLQGKFNAYIISGDNGIDKTIETYKSESKNFNKLFLKSFEYYKELLGNSLMLTTPNNEASPFP